MKFSNQHLEMSLSYEDYSMYSENLLTNISSDANNPMNGYAKTNLHILQRVEKSVQLTNALMDKIEKSKQMIFLFLQRVIAAIPHNHFPYSPRCRKCFPTK